MPLALRDYVLGTLTLYDRKSMDPAASRKFTEEDADVMANFCRQAVKGLARFVSAAPSAIAPEPPESSPLDAALAEPGKR
jgi:hypothetical protein